MRISLQRTVISLLLPLLAGIAAALYTPLSFWFDMKEGLIAFLGFLAASLMQVMPITANFIQADRLTPVDAKRIVDSLTKQQHYWIGLLSATIAALLVIVICSALKAPLEKIGGEWKGLPLTSVCCFFIAALFSFVLLKMIGLFKGMLSLHTLRAELVIDAANKAAAERKAQIQARAGKIPALTPENYGKVIEPTKD
ncbi:hypothetical protein N5C55_02790 [Pseudomonas otitidis]|uniref:hypothetical protein n=1 Tax=Metapseudomonas otitidis TaxID=319939 RepID=UPI002448720C|nr:hypothetical protein [Pseudomonas otitidis]MDH1104804.1 hypothetical protein [Pseudomonas otitidis]MDH1157091.1 hypothetical protein [Pseudomonas otitidis]MDH1164715.1 hypothetical protein [Pseudomonas otitidis]